uniref:HTH_Tnp_Tc3_2 domain-containing protein n=1 Tax=Caenorhabditis japonica TaxID=281687 RepID=A0A8R1EQ09_CAEJA
MSRCHREGLHIRRRLQVAGLHGRRQVKKPLVSLKNRKARVEWAKQHLSWGPREWANHIWSDESKFFNLFGTDGIPWIRRPIGSRYAPQYQCPTVKHGGGSVMVWGCFSDTSMGSLKRIVGTMDDMCTKTSWRTQCDHGQDQIWADRGCFSRIMTRSMLRVMSPIGFDVAVWISWNGQVSPRTTIPSNICGRSYNDVSKESEPPMPTRNSLNSKLLGRVSR